MKSVRNPRQSKLSKLKKVRETEGWTMVELAQAAGITPATLRKAEARLPIRQHIWGKILKGINAMPNKNHSYVLADILD